MTLLNQLPGGESTIRPDFTRDDAGMPLVSHPKTGKMTRYWRPSSYGKVLESEYNLTRWQLRNVVIGMAESAALVARALAADPNEANYRDELNAIAADAQAVAKAHERADIGTALHLMIKRASLGQDMSRLPEPFATDVAAYFACLERHGLEVVPGMVEMTCVHDGMRLAGTFDVVVRDRNGVMYVGDLKTGNTLRYSHISYGTQLAIYAHSQLYDTATNKRIDTPPVDKAKGLIFHLPAGTGECALQEVDLVAAGEAVDLVVAVRKMRNRTIITPVVLEHASDSEPPLEPVEVLTERLSWLIARYIAIRTHHPDALTTMANMWPAGVPTFKTSVKQTDDELALIEQVLDKVEAHHSIPFGAPPPGSKPEPATEPTPSATTTTTPDEGEPADPDMVRVLRDRYLAMPTEALAIVNAWTTAAKAAGGDLSVTRNPSKRRAEMARALQAFIAAGVKDTEDPVVRAAIAAVLGEDTQESTPVGAYLASFGVDHATRLADLAYGIVNEAVVIDIDSDGTVRLTAA